ncbi:hypothetical protein V7266_00590 [Neobacillus drentensis]|uniref:hypothetical protein n=1 Tax=Neobacillus drentensis TaxID=220684 RepID=UPI002FFD6B66
MSGLILFMIVPPVCKNFLSQHNLPEYISIHTYGSGQAFITDFSAKHVENSDRHQSKFTHSVELKKGDRHRFYTIHNIKAPLAMQPM